ncbi:hypothetical protein [Maridesulfovibrio sp.]|uniref:hypothetical protein n=1 Tax=Maridesulfovibrio sp. TaxID=2795000 RepID=UPI002A1887C0|nr:hypothetical protein [Maridesulfovibrio sp.]
MIKQTKPQTGSALPVLGPALFGAVVGGTAAAAKGIRQIRNNEASKNEVIKNIARETGTTAVAAGTAGAVAGSLKIGPVLSGLTLVAVATGVKYAMDSMFPPAKAAAASPDKKHAPLVMSEGATKPAKSPRKKAAPKSTTQKTKSTETKTAEVKTGDTEE